MAGDPKQLPPTLTSDGALDAQLDRTLFDRLQDTGQPLALLKSMPGIPEMASIACGKALGSAASRILLGRLQGPDEAPAGASGQGGLQHGDWSMSRQGMHLIAKRISLVTSSPTAVWALARR